MITRRRVLQAALLLPLVLLLSRGIYWTVILDGAWLWQSCVTEPSIAPPRPPPETRWQPPVPNHQLTIDKNGTDIEVFSQLFATYAFVPGKELQCTLLTQAVAPRRMHLYITHPTATGPEVTEIEIRNIEHVHWGSGPRRLAWLTSP